MSERGLHPIGKLIILLIGLLIVMPIAGQLLSPPARSQVGSASLPLSVLLISLDTLRADHLGCYGYPVDTSPTIDYISKKAIVFSQAFSQDSNTTPSHMTLFTSLFPSVHGIGQFTGHRLKLRPEVPTLTEVLRNAGYRTAAFTGGANVSHVFGFDRGFEQYNEDEPLNHPWDFSIFDTKIEPWFKQVRVGKIPSFCFFHTYRIHDPYLPPKPFNRMFNPGYRGPVVSAPREDRTYNALPFAERRKRFWDSVRKDNPDDLRQLKALYDGDIRYADLAIGRMVRLIDPEILQKWMLLAIVSDHGEEFTEHKNYLHSDTLYDELIHVPFILRLPGDTMHGLIKTESAGLIDLMPTVLELLGIKSTAPCQGRALLTPTAEKKDDGMTFAENMRAEHLRSAIRTSQWKFIRTFQPDIEELYHLSTDPQERRNLAAEPAFEKIRTNLQQLQEKNTAANRGLAISRGPASRADIDLETQDKLKSLGYLN